MSQYSFVRKANTPTQRWRKRYLLICIAWVVTLIFFGISTGNTRTAFAAQASTHHAGTLSTTPTAGGSVVSTPAAGPTGATITVNGSGWQSVPDGTPVAFDYSTDPTCTSYTAVTSTSEQTGTVSSGAFTGWFRWPTSTPIGTYTVCASIGPTIVAANTYTETSAISPQLTVSTPTVNVGQQEVVTGSNFLPAQTSVKLVLQQLNGGTSVTLGTVTSDANGAFTQAYTIPSNPTGPVDVIANGGGGTPPILTASATFIVYVTPVTPTPTPTPRPTPTPTPRPTPTPTANTFTPTAIQAQKQQSVATPTPIPTLALGPGSTANTASTATPTTVVAPQQAASTPTSTPGSGHGGNTSIAVIVGTLCLFLVAAIAGLFFWKKRTTTQQQSSSFNADPQAVQAASSWNPLRDPFSPVTPDPIAAPPITSASAWGASSLPGYAALTIPSTNYASTVSASTGYSRDSAFGSAPGGASNQYGTGYPGNDAYAGGDSYRGQTESDLLHDPLFAAIMQQTRTGLFVLPGKKEEEATQSAL